MISVNEQEFNNNNNMVTLRLWISLVILLLSPNVSMAQSGWADWNQQNPADNTYQYFMDSYATCGKTFQLGSSSAQVLGKGAGEPSESPTSCTITLSTDAVREERKFSIEVAAAQIYDAGVNFYIYDGQSTAGVMLDSFSYLKEPGPNFKKIITSGGFVTFALTRENSGSSYNIRIEVMVVAGDVPNPDNCIDGKGLGCENYYYNPAITKEQITAIVGGLFGVIIFIIIPLIVLYCYCKQRGVVKRWDEYKLDGHTNTAASIAGSSKATSYKEPWASQGSRRPYASIRRSPLMSRSRMSHTSEDDDSVFDDIPKRPAPPPPYEEHDRYDRYTRNNRGDFYDHKERNYQGEKYRRDDRNDRRGSRTSAQPPKTPKYRYGDAAENSYVQGDDDHPQDTFKERVVEPRVKSNAKIKRRNHQDEDETYDSIDETKKNALKSESEPEKTDNETQCDKESDTDESPETESEYESSSEEESEEESELEEKTDPRKALYAEPNKARKSTQKVKKKSESQPDKVALPKQVAVPQLQSPPVSQPVPLMYTGAPLPGVHGMHMVAPGMPMSGIPRPGMPIHQPGTQPMAFVPNHHQNARPVHFQNQYNPVLAQQNQFQPVPNIQRPPVIIPQQQQQRHPSQSHKFSHPKQPSHVKAMVNQADPPVYSYLVQRGYTPLDTGRHSPVSTSTGISYHSDYHGDDSDIQANLGSGVDLMKRTTEV